LLGLAVVSDIEAPRISNRICLAIAELYPAQRHASAATARVSRTKPGREHMAVHLRQLVVKQDLRILRPNRWPMLRSMEEAHRTALDNHFHRTMEIGVWVLIGAAWYP
jgi:hypothetical protein